MKFIMYSVIHFAGLRAHMQSCSPRELTQQNEKSSNDYAPSFLLFTSEGGWGPAPHMEPCGSCHLSSLLSLISRQKEIEF